MEGCRPANFCGLHQIIVRLNVVAGEVLAVEKRFHGLGPQDPARQLHPGENHSAVRFVIQIVWLDHRFIKGVRRDGFDIAGTFRPLLPRGDGHAGKLVEDRLPPGDVARRGERQLQIRIGDRRVRAPKGVTHRRRQAQDARLAHQELGDLRDQADPLGAFVDGVGVFDPGREAGRIVVTQVPAHGGQGMLDFDPQFREMGRIADPRYLQDLRGIDHATGEDNFLSGANFGLRPAAPALGIAHADDPFAVQHQPRDMRACDDVQVAALHGRVQERTGGTNPAPVVDRTLGIGHAFLLWAVVVGRARNADAFRPLNEGFAELVGPVRVGYEQAAVPAAKALIRLADPLFRAFEIRQDIGIPPAPVSQLGPVVVVLLVATGVDVAVDGTGAAQGLAARHRNGPSAGPFAGLRLIAPVQCLMVQQLHEAGGDMDHRMAVGWTGFENADPVLAAFRKTVGQNASGRAGTDDDVIVCIHWGALSGCLQLGDRKPGPAPVAQEPLPAGKVGQS